MVVRNYDTTLLTQSPLSILHFHKHDLTQTICIEYLSPTNHHICLSLVIILRSFSSSCVSMVVRNYDTTLLTQSPLSILHFHKHDLTQTICIEYLSPTNHHICLSLVIILRSFSSSCVSMVVRNYDTTLLTQSPLSILHFHKHDLTQTICIEYLSPTNHHICLSLVIILRSFSSSCVSMVAIMTQHIKFVDHSPILHY